MKTNITQELLVEHLSCSVTSLIEFINEEQEQLKELGFNEDRLNELGIISKEQALELIQNVDNFHALSMLVRARDYDYITTTEECYFELENGYIQEIEDSTITTLIEEIVELL